MMKRLMALVVVATAVGCGGQSAICKKYEDCTNAVVPGSFDSLNSTYGPSGSCWNNSTTADACSSACQEAVNALKANNPNVTACQ